jgi:hypothetical protein
MRATSSADELLDLAVEAFRAEIALLFGDPLLLGHRYGIKTADGSLAFPNAEIKVPTQDWAFWMSDDNAGKAEYAQDSLQHRR